MGLKIYSDMDLASNLSQGDFSNPLRISLDSQSDDTVEKLLYVKSDNSSLYDSITVQPVAVDIGRNLLTDTTLGYTWKLSAGATQPTEDEWEAITEGAAISLDDISTSLTYSPFWIKVNTPQDARATSYTHVVLRVSAIERIV